MIISLLPVESINKLVFNRLLAHCLKLSDMRESRSLEIEFLCWHLLYLWESSLRSIDFLVQLQWIRPILHFSYLLNQKVSHIFNLRIRLRHGILKAGKLPLWQRVIISLSRSGTTLTLFLILLFPLVLNILDLIIHFFISKQFSQAFEFILDAGVSLGVLAVKKWFVTVQVLLAGGDAVEGRELLVGGC
jgi:hypothetical protein